MFNFKVILKFRYEIDHKSINEKRCETLNFSFEKDHSLFLNSIKIQKEEFESLVDE